MHSQLEVTVHRTAERPGAQAGGSAVGLVQELPAAGHRPARGEVEVWLLRTDARQAEQAAGLRGLLDTEETERVARCGDEEGRASLLVSYVALRLLLGAYLEEAPGRVVIDRAPCRGCGRPHGRPVVTAWPAVHFSLSHTAGLAVCAFASAPVGADVETLASVPGTELVPLLHPAEQRAVRALPTDRQEQAFLHCFVRKEAYLKGTGDGLWAELDSFEVGLGPGFPATPDVCDASPEHWGFAALPTPATHGGAVALWMPEARGAEPRVLTRRLDLTDPAVRALA